MASCVNIRRDRALNTMYSIKWRVKLPLGHLPTQSRWRTTPISPSQWNIAKGSKGKHGLDRGPAMFFHIWQHQEQPWQDVWWKVFWTKFGMDQCSYQEQMSCSLESTPTSPKPFGFILNILKIDFANKSHETEPYKRGTVPHTISLLHRNSWQS